MYITDCYDGIKNLDEKVFVKPIIPTFMCFALIVIFGRVKNK